MNRRDFFTMGAKATVVASAAVATVKAVEPKRIVGKRPELAAGYITEEQVVDFNPRIEQVAHFPSRVSQMVPFRDQLIVCCEDGQVFSLTHDPYMAIYRMHESG